MAPCFSEVPVGQYFRVDVQDQLPECEINRRDTIKKELEAQFQLWQTEEQHCRYLSVVHNPNDADDTPSIFSVVGNSRI